MAHIEHHPGEPASRSGRYTQHNVFGAATGHSVDVEEGEPLPRAPRAFTWRHVPSEDC